MISLNKKIHYTQATVDYAGQARKHLVVELRGEQTIVDVLATPSAWLVRAVPCGAAQVTTKARLGCRGSGIRGTNSYGATGITEFRYA